MGSCPRDRRKVDQSGLRVGTPEYVRFGPRSALGGSIPANGRPASLERPWTLGVPIGSPGRRSVDHQIWIAETSAAAVRRHRERREQQRHVIGPRYIVDLQVQRHLAEEPVIGGPQATDATEIEFESIDAR